MGPRYRKRAGSPPLSKGRSICTSSRFSSYPIPLLPPPSQLPLPLSPTLFPFLLPLPLSLKAVTALGWGPMTNR
eukprot:935191-Amorphochlora_amoeboformis.AAC.1